MPYFYFHIWPWHKNDIYFKGIDINSVKTIIPSEIRTKVPNSPITKIQNLRQNILEKSKFLKIYKEMTHS